MFHAKLFRCLAIATLALVAAFPAISSQGDGRDVLRANATPAGYSLEDMAFELAYFDTSGNDLDYYPDTPFQILYVTDFTNQTGTFTVTAGTAFFVPVFSIDDSPTIFGNFPDDEDDIPQYIFGRDQIGAHDLQIVVDGHASTLGAGYAAGAHAPGLLDGGGSNIIQIGAFLTPLAQGTHTVAIRGTLDGDAIVDAFGGPYPIEATYTVIVK